MQKLWSLLLIVFFVAPTVFAADADSIEGTYKCKGSDPYINKDYTGTVTITKNGKVYNFDMHYYTGEASKGTGLLRNDMLMLVCQDPANVKDSTCIEYYAISKHDKKLVGEWVYLGKNKIGKETCSK